MTPFFAVPPHDHPGAEFEASPHAVTRLEIGGKKRTFWLKMREGVIYFREPTLVPLFAVPQLFATDLSHSAEELIEVWKEAVERHNYGAYIISHRQWPSTPASANYCIILRADGSGWLKEHFDTAWAQFALPDFEALNLWRPSPIYGDAAALVVRATRAQFLERAVDSVHFRTIPPRWTGGGSDEMVDVLRSAATLLFKPEDYSVSDKRSIEWNCKSGSSFYEGSVSSSLIAASSYQFKLVWNIAKWHYGFTGVDWKKASEHPELQTEYGARTWKRGIERWGENWRGNFVGSQYTDTFSMPPLSLPSHHDLLEALLVLREFLRDKMPPDKMDSLFGKVLSR